MSNLEEKFLLQVRALKLPEPVREFRFHSARRWKSDFAWPEHKLLVEIEGGVFSNGRHTRGKGFENDCIKYNEAQLLGYTVLRFTTTHVNNLHAVELVRDFLINSPEKT